MIFCTIGTQAPFDRFVKMIDEVAPALQEEIIVQTLKGSYAPQHVKVVEFLTPKEFNSLFAKARLIVAHAGMGTIISALNQDKPIIVFPRRRELKEHRSNHQIATADKLKELGYLYVVENAEELKDLLLKRDLKPLCHIGSVASTSLIEAVRQDIETP
jgi:UDP-N-acetylglucosamine transferase subunit ALG13